MIKDFDLDNYQIVPAIKKICTCGKVYNPDQTLKDVKDIKDADLPKILKNEILKCPKCDFQHHLSCMKQHYDNKCYSCKHDMSG